MTVQDVVTEQVVTLTDAAVAKIAALIAQEGRDDLRLRVAVQPGGCSGLRYQLYFDERSFDGDIVVKCTAKHKHDDVAAVAGAVAVAVAATVVVAVVIDKMSAPYLTGATIDFVDTIEKQGFTIDNPNATGSCACGDSFH
jgi:iron-sulfur cluster assembly accessory protein